jgi:hypothetical protein
VFVVVLLFLNGILNLGIKTTKTAVTIMKNGNHISDNVQEIVEIIDDNTKPDDKISVYGNYDIIYVLSGRAHATKYSYQFPIGEVLPYIIDEYFDELSKELPLIVVQENRYDEALQDFLQKNNYILLWMEDENGSLEECNSIFIHSEN